MVVWDIFRVTIQVTICGDLFRTPLVHHCRIAPFPAPGFASDTNVCEKFCISFTDQSNNNPVAWQWLFLGGTPSSSSARILRKYVIKRRGVFDVTLITTNANGNDTLLFPICYRQCNPPFPTITQSGYTLTSSLLIPINGNLCSEYSQIPINRTRFVIRIVHRGCR
jgi:PKD repeat protein